MVDGEYEFLDKDRTIRASVGSLIYVFRGNLHTHKNVGAGVRRMVVSQTPGGSHERFFEEVGKAVDGEPGSHIFENQPDLAGIVAIAAKYGIEIPLPMAQEKAGTGSSVSGRPLNR